MTEQIEWPKCPLAGDEVDHHRNDGDEAFFRWCLQPAGRYQYHTGGLLANSKECQLCLMPELTSLCETIIAMWEKLYDDPGELIGDLVKVVIDARRALAKIKVLPAKLVAEGPGNIPATPRASAD